MKTSVCAVALCLSAVSVQASIITQWTFNGSSSSTVPGGASSPSPATGSGLASLIGGVTSPGFSSGAGSSDTPNTAPPNFGWQTTTYAAQGTQNGERGVQFAVSTVGFTSIEVLFDTRHSNTSSANVRLDWSADAGATWNTGTVFTANAGDTWFNGRASGVLPAAASNNADFVFRMVSVFGATGQYVASNPTATYAGTGTLRWDMVTVKGIPAPGALALMGVAGLVAGRRRR